MSPLVGRMVNLKTRHLNKLVGFDFNAQLEIFQLKVTATYRFSLYLSGILATENVRPILSCNVTANNTFIPSGKVWSLSEFALTGDWHVMVSEDTVLTCQYYVICYYYQGKEP